MEKYKMADPEDGLEDICKTCGDVPGGCAQCGFGEKQRKEGEKEATPEFIKKTFGDLRKRIRGEE
jgi:hypothetical protein